MNERIFISGNDPIELTYEEVSKWFDAYYKGCNKYQGPLEQVVKLKEYFNQDFEFMMYTASERRIIYNSHP